MAGTCLYQKSTQDQFAELWQFGSPNPSCPYVSYFGPDGGGEGRCQEGFVLQEKGNGQSGVSGPQAPECYSREATGLGV